MKAAAAAMMLLLALVVAAAAAAAARPDGGSSAAATTTVGTLGRGHGGGRTWRDHHGHGGTRSPLAGLTECVTVCGSGVTKCMLDCYKPAVSFDPLQLPVCLLKCTNDAMVCGSGCATNL
jgi:opacity protein-like surface antigen